MKFRIHRCLALALGLCVTTTVTGQYGGYPTFPATQYQTAPSTVPLHHSLQNHGLRMPPGGRPGNPNWNNFHPPPDSRLRVADGQTVVPEQLPNGVAQPLPSGQNQTHTYGPSVSQYRHPAPAPPLPTQVHGQPIHGEPQHLHGSPAAQHHGSAGPEGHCESCSPAPAFGHIYQEAAAAPWGGYHQSTVGHGGSCAPPVAVGPAPLRNWFAGGSLLFLRFQDNCDQRLLYDIAMPTDTMLSTGQVSPRDGAAFETFFGRYFNCGQHAITAGFFFFDPSQQVANLDSGAGMLGRNMNVGRQYRAAMPSWNNIMYDIGADGDPANDLSMYTLFEDARHYRVSRDVLFQGVELNFVSFGIGGARRAGLGPLGVACGGDGGSGCGPGCGPAPGCGGACGPLIPPCHSKLQIQTAHGLRWLQFRDRFSFAASQMDTFYGHGPDDLYYNVNAQNNLIGYQFGTRFDYCLGRNLNVYAGAKMGIYANNVRYRSSLGATGMPGYVSGVYPSLDGRPAVINSSATVLSSLGELDLGIGYRVNKCWSINGGYRLFGITGVATSVGSIASDLAHLPSASEVCADKSILLHGGYVGAEYNW